MIIYNVTTKVNWAIHEDWSHWLKKVHMPNMIQTGCFVEARILRLLEADEEDGPTYAIQYYASSLKQYNNYLNSYAARLRQESFEKWGEQIVAFRTLMEVLH